MTDLKNALIEEAKKYGFSIGRTDEILMFGLLLSNVGKLREIIKLN